MLRADELIASKFYFMLTFADKERTVPGVVPLAYIGTNLFPAEPGQIGPTFWFQDAVSFFRFGSLVEYPQTESFPEDFVVRQFQESDIGVGIVDLDGVEQAVKSARIRARDMASDA